MAMDVEKTTIPGYGVSPALLESIVIEPLCSFKKGTAKEDIWKLALTLMFMSLSHSRMFVSKIDSEVIRPWHRNKWSRRPSKRDKACLNFFSV